LFMYVYVCLTDINVLYEEKRQIAMIIAELLINENVLKSYM